jgi:hypothetical protein
VVLKVPFSSLPSASDILRRIDDISPFEDKEYRPMISALIPSSQTHCVDNESDLDDGCIGGNAHCGFYLTYFVAWLCGNSI